MAPRVLFLSVLAVALAGCSVPQAETAAASDPVSPEKEPASTEPSIQRLMKAFAPGEVTLDVLDSRREALDKSFFESGPRSSKFEACIQDVGQQDVAMAHCEYDEAARLDEQMSALIKPEGGTPQRVSEQEQVAWELATKEGCAWSPSEEGTAGELGAAACVTNRLANRVAELQGRLGSEVGHE